MTEKKRRGGGGKLARTENVQVRLDPKLRFAAELAAAKERRTLSSFVEWAVDNAVHEIHVTKGQDGQLLSAYEIADEVWRDNEELRILLMGARYPELLTRRDREWFEAHRKATLEETLNPERRLDIQARIADLLAKFDSLGAQRESLPPEVSATIKRSCESLNEIVQIMKQPMGTEQFLASLNEMASRFLNQHAAKKGGENGA